MAGFDSERMNIAMSIDGETFPVEY